MNVKQFIKNNKYSLLLLIILLTVVLSISASFTMSKYTRTVPVQFLEIELTNKWPVLYRGFATVDPASRGMDGVTRIVMGSFDTYLDQMGFEGDINGDGLDYDDWTNRDERYWVQQESAQNPEGTNLRKGIKLFYRYEETEKVAYVLAKESYPVVFPIDSRSMFEGLNTLGSIAFEKIDTSIAENMQLMFCGCYAISVLDLSSFNTGNVTNMYRMFGDSHTLATIYVDNNKWNTTALLENIEINTRDENHVEVTVIVSGKGELFKGCTSLAGGSGTFYDENNVNSEYARIDGDGGLPGYFTAKN